MLKPPFNRSQFAKSLNENEKRPWLSSGIGLGTYLFMLVTLIVQNLGLWARFSDLGILFNSMPEHAPAWQYESTFSATGFMLALGASLFFCCRLYSISHRYSGSLLYRIQIGLLAFLAILPIGCHLELCTDALSKNTGQAISSIYSLIRGTGSSLQSTIMIQQTGELALYLAVVVIFAFVVKSIMFPQYYLRKGESGLAFGATGIWKALIGERLVAWKEIGSVSITGLKRAKKQLNLKTKSGSGYSFLWDELSKFVNPAELMSEIKTHAPDAVDDSCLVKSDSSSHEYTELWLKYFTSSSTRQRSGGLQPGERLHEGRYEIAGELGQGGQGTAYLASVADKSESEAVEGATTIVLKEYILPVHRGEAILQQSMKKLHHEAEILGKIHHPNIVELKDTFVEDHRGYLVLEYVEGNVLKQMVQSQGPQPEKLVVNIALQVLDALDHLHGMDPPVIHRDITPDNLILQPDGRVKLVDFNVAQQLESQATATVVGKHAYIPPEQFRGKPTKQSDIFALGGTLHFLLTGQEPEPLSVSHPCTLNESISEELDALVARATALEQGNRFADAQEFRQALLSLASKGVCVETPAPMPLHEQ